MVKNQYITREKNSKKTKNSQYNGEDSFAVITGLVNEKYTSVICIDLDKKG